MMDSKHWSIEQECYLIDNYSDSRNKIHEIVNYLGKDFVSIISKADELSLVRRAKSSWVQEDIIILTDGYANQPQAELENLLYRRWNAIARKAHELGLVRDYHNNIWTEEELDYLIEFYTLEAEEVLCKNLRDRSFVAIAQKARALKLERNNRAISKGYNFNVDFFSSWSKEMAWVLGWITSDGHLQTDVNRLKFELQERDEDVLCKIGSLLLEGYQIGRDSKRSTVRLSMNNRQFTKDLMFLGITNNKAFTVKPPDIPEEYISHYLRGVFEGDGCVNIAYPQNSVTMEVSFAGNEYTIPYIEENLRKALGYGGKVTQHPSKGGVTWVTRFHGKNAVNALEWLYKDSTTDLIMERKYKTYIDFMKNYGYERFKGEINRYD